MRNSDPVAIIYRVKMNKADPNPTSWATTRTSARFGTAKVVNAVKSRRKVGLELATAFALLNRARLSELRDLRARLTAAGGAVATMTRRIS
jgi:hypothetical protein